MPDAPTIEKMSPNRTFFLVAVPSSGDFTYIHASSADIDKLLSDLVHDVKAGRFLSLHLVAEASK